MSEDFQESIGVLFLVLTVLGIVCLVLVLGAIV